MAHAQDEPMQEFNYRDISNRPLEIIRGIVEQNKSVKSKPPNMNIQQLAAEKAREKYPLLDLINYSDGNAANLEIAKHQEIYTSAWQDCLNHFAGSEGDVMKMMEELHKSLTIKFPKVNWSNWDEEKDSEFMKVLIPTIQEHTATHCAKVLSQQHQREIKWSYDGIKYRIHMFYGESEHHCDSDFFTIIGLDKMGIPECTPPINQ